MSLIKSLRALSAARNPRRGSPLSKRTHFTVNHDNPVLIRDAPVRKRETRAGAPSFAFREGWGTVTLSDRLQRGPCVCRVAPVFRRGLPIAACKSRAHLESRGGPLVLHAPFSVALSLRTRYAFVLATRSHSALSTQHSALSLQSLRRCPPPSSPTLREYPKDGAPASSFPHTIVPHPSGVPEEWGTRAPPSLRRYVATSLHHSLRRFPLFAFPLRCRRSDLACFLDRGFELIEKYITLPRPVLILCLGTFINRAGSMMVVFLTVYLKEELGLSLASATFAPAAYGAGALVAAVIGGHLADRIGRRIVMFGSMFGGGAILLLFGHLTSPWLIVGATGVFAMVMECYRPAASAMIADLVEPERRIHAFGLMYVSINLGFSIAPLLGSFLIANYSFVWLFRIDAFTATAYAILILFTIAETLPSRRSVRIDVEPADGDGPNSEQSIDDRGQTRSFSFGAAVLHILGDRPFLCYCLATLCICSVYSQAITTFPLYLAERGFGPEIGPSPKRAD